MGQSTPRPTYKFHITATLTKKGDGSQVTQDCGIIEAVGRGKALDYAKARFAGKLGLTRSRDGAWNLRGWKFQAVSVTATTAVSDAPKLRVWWIPQVPMKAFRVSVASIDEAKLLLSTLAKYDQFQLDNNIKPDYANAGGLEVLEGCEWNEWHNDDGDSIDDIMRT